MWKESRVLEYYIHVWKQACETRSMYTNGRVIFSVLLLFPDFRNELVKMGLEVIQEAKETQHASVT